MQEEELRLLDDTIQTLFAIGLKIEYSLVVFDQTPEQARSSLEHIVLDLGDVISELRNRIDLLK